MKVEKFLAFVVCIVGLFGTLTLCLIYAKLPNEANEAKQQIENIEVALKENWKDSNLEEFLELSFEVDGTIYMVKEANSKFYENTSYSIEIENPVFISRYFQLVYKDRKKCYCYLLQGGKIAFSDERHGIGDFVKVEKSN